MQYIRRKHIVCTSSRFSVMEKEAAQNATEKGRAKACCSCSHADLKKQFLKFQSSTAPLCLKNKCNQGCSKPICKLLLWHSLVK